MKTKAIFEQTLPSPNSFRSAATKSGLEDELIEIITAQLRSIYDANTSAERLNHLVKLNDLISTHELNSAAAQLLYSSNDFVRLILGEENPEKIPGLLEERALRTPFLPTFVRDAPRDAPHRWLIDALSDWRRMTDPSSELAQEKLQAIIRASTYRGKKDLKDRLQKIERKNAPLLTDDQKMFIALSTAHSLKHLFLYGTTKLPNEDYQHFERQNNILPLSLAELLRKQVYPMGNRLYQIHQRGEGDDRCFSVSYYSTENCVANDVHPREASFRVSISGNIFAEEFEEIGSRFDRNPFFAGNWRVDNEGRLLYYDNYSVCFNFDERNLICLTRYFHDLGLIGEHNPKVVAGLAKQRDLIHEKQAFSRYAQEFAAFELWQANENLYVLEAAQVVIPKELDRNKLRETAIQESKEGLNQLREELRIVGDVPEWLENWELYLDDPRVTLPAVVDHLNTDAVNLHGFLDSTKTSPAGDPFNLPPCEKAAQDDRAAGIRNDFDAGALKQGREAARKKLQELRKKIHLKERLDFRKMQCEIRNDPPNKGEMKLKTIYFYHYTNSKSVLGFSILLDNESGLKYESQLSNELLNKAGKLRDKIEQQIGLDKKEEKALKKLALRIHLYEKILMESPHVLLRSGRNLLNFIKKHIQSTLPLDIAMAFSDELKVVDRQQVNNLCFGKMCLFHTNRPTLATDKHFDPKKKNYRTNPKYPVIDHRDHPPIPKKLVL